ncbi:MAG: TetR/AcrR family transcriptional regulator [Haliangiales bacterium]
MAASKNTKTKLLDAAEELFNEHGFERTSTRAIALAAGTNSAAPNFHFGSKAELYRAVFERRMKPLVAQRMELIQTLTRGTNTPDVDVFVDSAVLPLIDMMKRGDKGEMAFLGLLAKSTVGNNETLRSLLTQELQSYTESYFSMVQAALPHLERDEVILRIVYMMGVISHAFSDTSRRPMFGASEKAYNPDYIYRTMKRFLVAGLKAPAS